MGIKCPACGVLFACDPVPSGRGIACPSCGESFSLSAPEYAITTVKPPLHSSEEGIITILPAAMESCAPQRLGQRFALEEGIDLNEVFEHKVPNGSEATSQLHKWQWEMPKVASAYYPSGELPTSAVVFLILGSLVGCVAGLIAGVLVGSAGVALSAVFDSLGFYRMPFFGFAYSFGFLLFTGIGAFCIPGWVSAWCTTRLGEWGKNRNLRAAVLLSVIASIIVVVFVCVCYYKYIGSEPLLERRTIRLPGVILPGLSDVIFGISAVAGLVIAPVVAGFIAANRVRAAKFCENCKSFMGVTRLRLLSLGCLRALVRAFIKNRIDVAESLLHGPSGEDGEARLYSCRSCSRGFLEVTANYKAVWEGNLVGGFPYAREPTEKRETWLAVSCELSAADVERLREELLQTPN